MLRSIRPKLKCRREVTWLKQNPENNCVLLASCHGIVAMSPTPRAEMAQMYESRESKVNDATNLLVKYALEWVFTYW
jgi:hypothetical protein